MTFIKKPPLPEGIKKTRKEAGLTQAEMANMLGLTDESYISKYERYDKDGSPIKKPDPQTWTLFLILTNQHPDIKTIIDSVEG